MTGRSREDVIRWVEVASLWEACAPKPGNVNRFHDFHDASLPDFLTSAALTAQAFRKRDRWSVGSLVLGAVQARRAVVRSNTNLGILLLLVPLALGALRGPRGTLREMTTQVLEATDGDDARLVYEAIRLAAPGGLGDVDGDDVKGEAPPSLLAAMAEAADRDSVAAEYVTGFALTFDLLLPELRKNLGAGLSLSDSIVRTFLSVLAVRPDTLIARKVGMDRALEVSRKAERLLTETPQGQRVSEEALNRFDAQLRVSGNRLNPGTTADLIVAGLFSLLAEGPWSEAELLARWNGLAQLPKSGEEPCLLLPRRRRLELGRRTLLMGIVNVTPDSFYGGSRVDGAAEAVDRARAMIADGVDLLDIGAQSTRPGASEVGVDEEKGRLIGVIAAIRASLPEAVLSVDTSRASVAEAALDAGADMINDVTALSDPEMAGLAARRGVPVIVMHMKGTPQTMQDEAFYGDVVAEVCAFLAERVQKALDAGIGPGQIVLDPGIGFAKKRRHSLALLKGLDRLRGLGFPLLVGHSRKSFLDPAQGGSEDPDGRLEETLAVTAYCAQKGVEILRVHDVAPNRKVLAVAEALKGLPS